jgi:hypothetical protein
MSVGKWLFGVDATADASLTGALSQQGLIVKQTALDTVGLVSAATDHWLGVLVNDPKQNDTAEVQTDGVATVLADGSGTAIAVGDFVGPNGSAVAIKKATADYNLLGQAMDACSVANVFIRVKLYSGPTPFRTFLG